MRASHKPELGLLMTLSLVVCLLAAGMAGAATTVSFQDGLSGYAGTVDTMIRQAAPTTAYTASTSIGWDSDDPAGTGNDNFVLIRFDNIFGSGAGQIPVNSVILSATLSYYVSNTGNVGNVNEVVVDWTEAVTYDTFGGDAGVQAEEYGAARGSATGAAGTNPLDVTASIAAWSANASANKGWIIRPTGNDGVDFYTREWATATQRPTLTVTYVPPNTVGINPDSISTVVGKSNIPISVAIPSGSNAGIPVNVTLTTNSAAAAVPVGAVGNSLTLTFAQGGSTVQNASIDIGSAGAASIVTTNDAGLNNTTLPVNVASGTIAFDPPFLAMPTGSIPVRILLSSGSNETRAVQVTLTSNDPAIAVPIGGSGGSLTLTFAVGGPVQQTVTVQALNAGDTSIVSTNTGGLTGASLNLHAVVGFNFTLTADPRSIVSEWEIVLAAMQAKLGGVGAFHVTAGDLDPPAPLRSALDARFGSSTIWYPCVGNHEAETPADMTWVRSEYTSGNGVRTPLKNLTNQDGPAGSIETMYSWDYGNAHFVMLNVYWNGGTASGSDVAVDGDIVQAAYDWLAADLAANTKPAVFVIGHEPAYPFNRHVGDSLDKYPARRDAFWTLLENKRVHAYLVGHTHYYSKYQKTANSTWQIDAGTAGNDNPPRTFVNILVSSTAIEYYVWNNASGTFQLAESWSAPVGYFKGELVSETIPATMFRRGSYNCSITMNNSGSQNWLCWPSGSMLTVGQYSGPVANKLIPYPYYPIYTNPCEVAVGQNCTFPFTIDVPGDTLPGVYTIEWQMKDNSIWYDGIYTKNVTVPAQGDLDGDGDSDVADVGVFMPCTSGASLPHNGTPTCDASDLDDDGDVDQSDFGILQRCLSGPGVPSACH